MFKALSILSICLRASCFSRRIDVNILIESTVGSGGRLASGCADVQSGISRATTIDRGTAARLYSIATIVFLREFLRDICGLKR
jgi:hypothetical protein